MDTDLEIKLESLRNEIHSSIYYKQIVWNNKMKGNWSKLWSAFDNIQDTQDAIIEYSSMAGPGTLATYGVLQALIVQQDAVRHLEEAISVEPFKTSDFPELKNIRNVRNETIGHPTETEKRRGKSVYENGEISYTSMSVGENSRLLEYLVWTKNGAIKKEVDLKIVIDKQGQLLSNEIDRVMKKIMEEEMRHMETFRSDSLEKKLSQSAYFIQKLWPFETERYYSESCFRALIVLYEEFKQGIRDRYKIENLDEQGIQIPGLIDVAQKVDKLIPKIETMLPMGIEVDEIDLEVYVESLDNAFKEFRIMAKEIDDKFKCTN